MLSRSNTQCLDMVEGARRFGRQRSLIVSAVRSLTASQSAASCRRRDMSTVAKPGAGRGRGYCSRSCSRISNLLSRVHSMRTPPQFSGLSLSLMARSLSSTASAKLKICVGWPTTSGCRHLPGSMRYQPRLVNGLAVVGRDRRHRPCGRVVAPGEAGGGGRLHRGDHGLEEVRRLKPHRRQDRGS